MPTASCHETIEHDDDRADEHERVLHEQHEALRDQLLHRVDVGGHARDDLAGLLGLEVVEREAHHVTEQPVAQVAEEPLADRGRRGRSRAGRARSPTNATTRYAMTVWSSALAFPDGSSRCGRPASMPCFTSSGPASSVAACAIKHEHRDDDQPAPRPQHAQQAAHDARRLVARQRLLGNVVAPPAH